MSENKPKPTSTAKKQTKSTQAELNQRVSEIQALLLQGYTRFYIVQYASKWAVSDRQVDDYIHKATVNLKEINSITLESNMALIASNLWDLFRKARTDNDLSEQHKILMSIAKLKGLDQHAIHHIIEDKRELAEMSDEDLETALNVAALEQDRH